MGRLAELRILGAVHCGREHALDMYGILPYIFREVYGIFPYTGRDQNGGRRALGAPFLHFGCESTLEGVAPSAPPCLEGGGDEAVSYRVDRNFYLRAHSGPEGDR
jgi:hypothetical protein